MFSKREIFRHLFQRTDAGEGKGSLLTNLNTKLCDVTFIMYKLLTVSKERTKQGGSGVLKRVIEICKKVV